MTRAAAGAAAALIDKPSGNGSAMPTNQRAQRPGNAAYPAPGLDPEGPRPLPFREACTKDTLPMLSDLHAFTDWLAGTPLSTTIQNVSWIIPTVQTVHIVCVAIVIAAVFLVDLRILGVFARGQPVAALSHRFLPWIWYALIVLLITGSLLVIGEPGRSLTNPAFIAKMLMLLTVAASRGSSSARC